MNYWKIGLKDQPPPPHLQIYLNMRWSTCPNHQCTLKRLLLSLMKGSRGDHIKIKTSNSSIPPGLSCQSLSHNWTLSQALINKGALFMMWGLFFFLSSKSPWLAVNCKIFRSLIWIYSNKVILFWFSPFTTLLKY